MQNNDCSIDARKIFRNENPRISRFFFFLSKYYVIDPQEAGSSGIGSHWPDKSFAPGV